MPKVTVLQGQGIREREPCRPSPVQPPPVTDRRLSPGPGSIQPKVMHAVCSRAGMEAQNWSPEMRPAGPVLLR